MVETAPRPLLFVGDIHLGRTPHRLGDAGLNAVDLGPAEAWRRVVRYAVDRRVQAVILAGDVVDQDKDRFEAFGHLQRGVERLVAAGITVVGVAGNHDAIALPRLAARIDAFQLLGEGGRWQRIELDGVDLVGWSFPTRHFRGDPVAAAGLDEAMATRRAESLCLGVLHTDLDGGERSPYAPTRRHDLAALGLDGWLLGHIHQPSLKPDTAQAGARTGPQIGYLGSVIGLDRGELDRRGPWLISPRPGRLFHVEQVPLGPTYWTSLTVDVSAVEAGLSAGLAGDMMAGDAMHDALHDALRRGVVAAAQGDIQRWLADGDFRAVGCSIRLTGQIDRGDILRRFIADRTAQELTFGVVGVPWVVVRLVDATRPRRNMAVLAEERSPLGQLARLLMALQEGGEAAIPQQIRADLARFEPNRWLSDGATGLTTPPTATETIRAGIVRLLDALLLQREDVQKTRGAQQSHVTKQTHTKQTQPGGR